MNIQVLGLWGNKASFSDTAYRVHKIDHATCIVTQSIYDTNTDCTRHTWLRNAGATAIGQHQKRPETLTRGILRLLTTSTLGGSAIRCFAGRSCMFDYENMCLKNLTRNTIHLKPAHDGTIAQDTRIQPLRAATITH